MKAKVVLTLCASAALLLAQDRSASGRANDETTIRRLNEQVLKAYNAGEFATVERIEDDGFTLSGEFGELDKAQQMEREHQRKDFSSTVQLTVENARLRFFGDTALLTEVEKWGDPAQTAGFQTTSVWVKRGADWKVVHLHYSQLGGKAQ